MTVKDLIKSLNDIEYKVGKKIDDLNIVIGVDTGSDTKYLRDFEQVGAASLRSGENVIVFWDLEKAACRI